jgi:carbonic anhydrase/acetyltransferase-like protein (isoleucine patch superfamily)
MIESFEGKQPEVTGAHFIAWNAQVSGDVVLGKESSVWFGVSMRADIAPIRIGEGSNIQDNAVCHVSTDVPLTVGNGVTVGHGAIIHSCTIEDNCLIGMGAIVLDKAVIGRDSIVAAGSLVTGGKQFPPRSMIMGNPAKLVKELTDEQVNSIKGYAQRYRENSRKAAASYTAPGTYPEP